MKDVLYTLYQPLDGPKVQQCGRVTPPPEYKDAISLDKSLVEWLHRIPEYLRVGAVDGLADFRRARNILLTR